MDIAIVWDNNAGYGDFAIEDNDIALDYGLTTSVVISLFSDGRDPQQQAGGFWGDSLADDEEHELGSLKWTLISTTTGKFEENLPVAKQYEKQSLAWMIPGYATSLEIDFEPGAPVIFERVRIYGIITDISAKYWEQQFAITNSQP
jgi:phage gp46-like protein